MVESFWQKDSLITHILFELCMLILILSSVYFLMRHPQVLMSLFVSVALCPALPLPHSTMHSASLSYVLLRHTQFSLSSLRAMGPLELGILNIS